MAPGQYGSYRNHDFSCSEFGVDVLKKEFYERRHVGGQRKEERHGEGIKMQNLAVIAASNRNYRDRSMQSGACFSKRFMNREPGELSSEDRSGIDDGLNDSEDKEEVSSGKKRKLSQLECDMDDKSSAPMQKTRNKEHMQTAHPQLHPVKKTLESISIKKMLKYEQSSVLFDKKTSINSIRGVQFDNVNFTEQMEEDTVLTSTLALSRWAEANDFAEDDENTASDAYFLSNKSKNDLVSAQELKPKHVEDVSQICASSIEGPCREACIEPSDDSIDGLNAYGADSNGEERDRLLEGCMDRALDSMGPRYKTLNMLQCCRNVDEFEKLNKINEGTYGVVFRAKDKRNGEIVALKKVKMEKEREGFPLTSLREINILLSIRHPSIVEVKEVVVGRDLDDVFTVMEYMEHDLKGLIETMKKPFHLTEVKCLMLQLLAGVKHLHDNWVLHRDLKTSNLLFNNRGELKICDFGLSRQYGSPLKPYTKLVVTLWYRAPELLLGSNEYSTAVDMWSLGCIMAELITKEPLFPGKSELDQLDKIFRVLGTPNEKTWPGFTKLSGATANIPKKPFKLREKFPRISAASFLGRPMLSDTGFNLLSRLLAYDPEKRITAEEALNHPWFCESPLPTTKEFMPTFPAVHGKDRHQRRIMKSPNPLEQLMQNSSQ